MSGNNYSQGRARNRWPLLVGVIVTSLLLSGCGTQKPKVYRVGIMALSFFEVIADGFKAKMTELGYVEGQNIAYDLQIVSADQAEMQKVLDKFVADEVDLIFAFPTEPALLAKAKTQGTNIPVLFVMGTIEGNDLVKSVREPGDNITGVRFAGPDLYVKYLEVLLDLAPNTKRVGLFYDPEYPAMASTIEALRAAAPSVGVTLVEVHVASDAELEANLQARAKLSDVGFDATILMPAATLLASYELIGKFSAEHELPFVAGRPRNEWSVFTLIPDDIETGEQAAPLADKILRGTPAGEIPVASPNTSLRINYKRAQELGLTVPEGLLKRAVEIIR
jgi:putative ABC transport system substrate-binding protein